MQRFGYIIVKYYLILMKTNILTVLNFTLHGLCLLILIKKVILIINKLIIC